MILKLDKVAKRVGRAIHLYEVDLELEQGLTVLIGQTLAGKTSLLRLMAGLDKPTAGRVYMDGRDVTDDPVQKRGIAMVYQQFINYPSLTVYDNIASPLRLARLDKGEIDHKVREIAEMMHIERLLDRLPEALSGGEQQRTAMARALVKDAQLLLFDEPLVNLDYKLREELRAEMREIFKRRRAIVVYATTEPSEALILGGNSVVMDAGRVLQTGPAIQVYRNPATVRVAEVFSDPPINCIDGEVADGEIRLGNGAIRFAAAGSLRDLQPGRYLFGVRGNHLTIARSAADDVEIHAQVELAEVSGSETFIHVTHGDSSWVVQEEGVYSLAVGKEIHIFLSPRHVFAFDQSGRLVASPERSLAS